MTILTPAYFDVMTILSDNNLGKIDSDLFGGEWGSCDKQTLCLEGVGVPSELKQTYENPGIQILCRGEKAGQEGGRDIDVYAQAKAVSDFLLNLDERVTINDVCYTGFEPSSNIAPLGKDENERFIYSMNFTTYRNQS
jgi:hypothetical protein